MIRISGCCGKTGEPVNHRKKLRQRKKTLPDMGEYSRFQMLIRGKSVDGRIIDSASAGHQSYP